MDENVDEIDIIPLKIFEKSAISKSTRQAKERKEELSHILRRLENIYGEFEKPIYNPGFSSLTSLFSAVNENSELGNVECVQDVPALEQLLNSSQCRQKYLKQVTVFIVGYSNMAGDRLKIMQEVNQFFINSEDMFDSFIERDNMILNENPELLAKKERNKPNRMMGFVEEEEYTTSELSSNVQQAIDSCYQLTNRLGELNNEMIDCFVKYVQSKAGNKGRKKLEKALENAINDTNRLNEKLSQTLKVISDKDFRIDNLMKQLEAKSKEVQKFKTAAESVKKAALECDKLKEEISARDAQILNLQSELAQSQMKIEQTKILDAAQRVSAEESAQEFQEKCKQLSKLLEEQKIEFEETKRNMKRQHAAELKQLQTDNENRIQQITSDHQQEIEQLKSSEFDENAIALQWSEPEDEDIKPDRRSSSNISKHDQIIPMEKKLSISNSSPHSRIGSGKIESRQTTIPGSSRSSGKNVMVFSDAPDLDNEEFWSCVPRNHLLGRFSQYRQLAMASMSQMLDQIESLESKNIRQIHSLKSQHQHHKRRWDEEREMLIETVRKTENETKDAQAYVDKAMDEIGSIVSLIKLDESKKNDVNLNDSLTIPDAGLLERIYQIQDYLNKNNLLVDPITKLMDELLKKCQKFVERTRLFVPKFSSIMSSHRQNKIKLNIKLNEQEDEFKSLSSKTDVIILDENKDIMFPEEITDEGGKRSIAVSASPSLVRIAFYNDDTPANASQFDSQGVTAKDLEIPSGMIDIEDRTGLNLIQHPVVTSYLHSYDEILTFKEHVISILQDIDETEISDILNLRHLNPVSIRSQNRIIPQIEEIGKSIEKILHTLWKILERLLLSKRKFYLKLKEEPKINIIVPTKGKHLGSLGKSINYKQFGYLLEESREMKNIIKLLRQSYQSQFISINNSMTKLRQMFLVLNKQLIDKHFDKELVPTKNQKLDPNISVLIPAKTQGAHFSSDQDFTSVSIFFNRRDSERNVGRMRQAVIDQDFPKLLYKEAIEKMSSYVEIPTKQLHLLVQKYVHRDAMDKISELVKRNQTFTPDTFKILNQMELYIEKKQRRYSEIMEYLRNERILRAKLLMDTCEKIENDFSILLIKPIFTQKSRNIIRQYIIDKNLIDKTFQQKQNVLQKLGINKEQDMPNNIHSNQIWRQDNSIAQDDFDPNFIPESKLLEIDTNRMLLPLNNISVSYGKLGLIGNELFLPPQVAVRSYVAVAHPTRFDNVFGLQDLKSTGGKIDSTNSKVKSPKPKDLSKHSLLPPITSVEEKEEMVQNSNLNDELMEKLDKENQSENVY